MYMHIYTHIYVRTHVWRYHLGWSNVKNTQQQRHYMCRACLSRGAVFSPFFPPRDIHKRARAHIGKRRSAYIRSYVCICSLTRIFSRMCTHRCDVPTYARAHSRRYTPGRLIRCTRRARCTLRDFRSCMKIPQILLLPFIKKRRKNETLLPSYKMATRGG